jgi:hypothetical protein
MEARRVALPDQRSRSARVQGLVRCPHNERAKFALRAAGLLAALVWTTALQAATVTTRNFVVHAPTEDVARQVADTAEVCRRELAIAWLGEELPPWYRRCPIKVKVGQIGAGGATTFTFEGGEVFGWNMNVQGTLERILDSVVPHEVSHTIFASHFRRPLPRWADEGAATLVEHESERLRQTKLLNQVLNNNRRIPLQQLLEITEYPEDMQQVLTLYAEGYSLADFLVQQAGDEGRATYLAFLADAHEHDWTYAFKKHYGYKSIRAVEKQWTDWIIAGSPELPAADGGLVADAGTNGKATNVLASATPANSPPRTTAAASAPREPLPLAPIQRRLRTRVSGSDLDAPEPNVTARPAREVEAPPADPQGEQDSAAAPAVTLDFNATERSDEFEADTAATHTDSRSSDRRPRPENGFPPQQSLRDVNANYDEAFQQ